MKSTDEASSGMLEPDIPDLACGHGNIDRSLDALDQLDQVLDLLLAAVDGFVADHDAVDVAVALGEIDRRQHLALVAVGILVDPGADRDLETGLVGDRRHQFDAAGRRIEPDRAGQRRQRLHIGADLVRVRNVVDVGMRGALERRVGHARQNALEVGRLLPVPQHPPHAGVNGGHEQQNGDDGAHRD